MKWAGFSEAIAALVPAAKAMGVIVTLSVGAFMAGVGAVLGFGEYAGLPEAVAALEMKETDTATALATLRVEFDAAVEKAEEDRRRIMCLVEITATGEVVLAAQLESRCP